MIIYPGTRTEGYRVNPSTRTPPQTIGTSLGGGGGNAVTSLGRSPFTAAGHGISSSVTSATSSLFDFTTGNNVSPSSQSSVVQAAACMLENQRLQTEIAIKTRAFEERLNQIGNVWI